MAISTPKFRRQKNKQMYESLKLKYEIEIGRFAYVISIARESQNNKYGRVTGDYNYDSLWFTIRLQSQKKIY